MTSIFLPDTVRGGVIILRTVEAAKPGTKAVVL